MCLILGFMISMAWVTNETRSSRQNYVMADQKNRVAESSGVDVVAYNKMSTEMAKLQAENARLEKAIGDNNSQTNVLNDLLQEMKVFAGLTKVDGPGVVVRLRDSPKAQADSPQNGGIILPDSAIHDTDVLKVVNELFAAGAESISVNQQRIVNRTAIRCVGPTILINDVKIAPPVVVRAIGDPDTLFGGLNLPGGVLSEIRQQDPAMVDIEKVQSQELPAYVGTTSSRYMKVPEDKPVDSYVGHAKSKAKSAPESKP